MTDRFVRHFIRMEHLAADRVAALAHCGDAASTAWVAEHEDVLIERFGHRPPVPLGG